MEEYEIEPQERASLILSEIHNCIPDGLVSSGYIKRLAQIQIVNIVNELTKWGAPNLFEHSGDNDWANDRIYKYWVDVSLEIEKS